ncbi:MAG TPA: fatty acid desaturase [Alphaproteobacteria bacterium]|nr:fatty acid desaturase [Alphaproteobacteria bacterium]
MDAEFVPPGLDRRPLAALTARSDRAGLVRLIGHVGTLAGTGALVLLAWGQPLLLLPAMAVHGAVLVFLFAPLHECIHRTAFRSRWPNDGVALVCGLVLLLPPHYFRAFHFAHHRHTQDPSRDPELAQGGRPTTRGAFLWHLSGLPYWAFQARLVLRHAWGWVDAPFLTAAMAPRVIREARLVLTIYAGLAGASFAFGSWLLLLLWVGPALLGQPWLRAFLAAEHMLCPLVPEMARNTRTTRASRLTRYYGWNMSFHAEHHIAPALPFHALPKAHVLLHPALAIIDRSYASVLRQIWTACMSGGGVQARARN